MRRARGMRGIMVRREGKEEKDKMPIRRRLFQLTAIPTILCPHVRESSKVFPAKASRISVRTSIEGTNH
jgi:hypothetical protein